MSEAGELKEELKTLKAEYQSCQSHYEEERGHLESHVTALGEKLASLEKTSHVEREEKARLEKELRKVRNIFLYLCYIGEICSYFFLLFSVYELCIYFFLILANQISH